MKTIVLFWVSMTLFGSQPDFNAIISAIQAKQTAQVAVHFDEQVELTLAEQEEGIYPKAQATTLVAGFLNQYPSLKCSLVHTGSARDGASYYCIGSLSAGGNKYRVYIFFKKMANGYKIQELRFEEE